MEHEEFGRACYRQTSSRRDTYRMYVITMHDSSGSSVPERSAREVTQGSMFLGSSVVDMIRHLLVTLEVSFTGGEQTV